MQRGEWFLAGCPKNTWFSITRHEDEPDLNTPQKLASLILLAIQNDCKELDCNFEMKMPPKELYLGKFYEFEYQNYSFRMNEDMGIVNSEYVPVFAVTAHVRMIT